MSKYLLDIYKVWKMAFIVSKTDFYYYPYYWLCIIFIMWWYVYASACLFTFFQSGFADPPDMLPALTARRKQERDFIDQLLDPSKLQPFSVDVQIHANLRKYQLVRFIIVLSIWIAQDCAVCCPYEHCWAVHMNRPTLHSMLSIWIAQDCAVCCPYEHCWAVHVNRSWLRSMLSIWIMLSCPYEST